MDSRGFRNNNPGNLRHSPKNKWNGLADPPADKDGYCRFKTAVYGLRAIVVLLLVYQDRHGLNTPLSIIERWAPATENNPRRYAAYVAKKMKVGMTEEIDTHKYVFMRPLLEAIVDYENEGDGTPYSNAEYDRACMMAGVPPLAEQSSPQITASQVVAGGTVASLVSASEAAQPVINAVQNIAPIFKIIGPYLWYAVGLAVLGAAGFMIYNIIDRRSRGL